MGASWTRWVFWLAILRFGGAEVQPAIDIATGNAALTAAGYTLSYTNWQNPVTPPLTGTPLRDVYIVTTHQYTRVPSNHVPPPVNTNRIPAGTNFGYRTSDLGGIQARGGLLLFLNHAGFQRQTPFL